MKLLSFTLALFLFLLQWKARVIHLHLGLFKWDKSTLGLCFRFRWCLHLSLDLIDALRGKIISVHLSPRDRDKFIILQSQPALFLTAHFHNWEALAAWMTRHGVPLLGAARPLSTPLFHELLAGLRKRNNIPVLTQGILPGAMSHLRAGHCFGILWDQYSPLHRHRSQLFGIPAAMDPLPEILVRRYRPAVMAGFLLPGGFLRLVPLAAAGAQWDPERLSRRFNRVLEIVVRAHPTYWYGLCHARFKGTVTYPGRGKVSRETSAATDLGSSQVSRETSAAIGLVS